MSEKYFRQDFCLVCNLPYRKVEEFVKFVAALATVFYQVWVATGPK